MATQIPVKPISEIEVKSEVTENDKVLILDSESEEARLAPKDELKGTDAWEYMTQQEYDNLPSSKLTDDISRAVYADQEFYFKTLLRAADNLLHYNSNDELYADLQLENGITPTSNFPIWVCVGNVNWTDGWSHSGVLINSKTLDWNYIRWLYGENGKLYFDGWTGVFKEIFTSDDVSDILDTLRSELAEVAFTWKSSDLDNDADFNSVPVLTEEQREDLPWTAWDDKRYFIYEEI